MAVMIQDRWRLDVGRLDVDGHGRMVDGHIVAASLGRFAPIWLDCGNCERWGRLHIASFVLVNIIILKANKQKKGEP